jgi:hypothetical protein
LRALTARPGGTTRTKARANAKNVCQVFITNLRAKNTLASVAQAVGIRTKEGDQGVKIARPVAFALKVPQKPRRAIKEPSVQQGLAYQRSWALQTILYMQMEYTQKRAEWVRPDARQDGFALEAIDLSAKLEATVQKARRRRRSAFGECTKIKRGS